MSPIVERLESRTLFSTSFLSQLTPTPTVTGNTIPGNGDVNPYGVAIVQTFESGGKLHAGDVLVSNFNDSDNLQGTGTTIVEINSKTGCAIDVFSGPKRTWPDDRAGSFAGWFRSGRQRARGFRGESRRAGIASDHQ